MAIRDIFKVSRRTFFNPAAWLDYQALRTNTNTIVTTVKSLFTIPKPLREETFEQAMVRLRLSEEEVKISITSYRQFALFFLVLSFLSFVYAFFLLFRHWTFMGWLLGLGVSLLFLSQAFKYDFWALQMRKRKLGLSFADWKAHFLGLKRRG